MGTNPTKMSHQQPEPNTVAAPGTVDTEGPTSEFVKSTTTVGVEALKPGERYTVDDAIDQIGWGRFQNRVACLCGVSMICVSMQMLLHAFNISVLKHQWGLSTVEGALLGSSVFMGMLLGSITWGALSDRYGRKKVFMLTVFCTATFGFLSGFAPSFPYYFITRMLLGLGMGGQSPVTFSLLLEYTPKYCRGYAVGMVWVSWYIGEALEVMLGYVLEWGNDNKWRYLCAISSIPSWGLLLLWLVNIIIIPESPRFLMISGQQRRGWDALQKAAEENQSILFRQKLIGATTNKDWVQATSRENRGSVRALFSRQLRTTTILLWIIWFVAGYGFYGLMFLLPEFLREKMSLTAEHFGVLVSSAGACGGVICGALLSESLGRRPTFVVGFFFAGVFIMLINVEVDAVWLVVFAMVARFFTGVYEAVWYTYTPEVYPTSVRALGFGMCSFWAKVSGLVAPVVSTYVNEAAGPLATTAVTMCAFFSGALAAMNLPVETKGRPLTDYVSEGEQPVDEGTLQGAEDNAEDVEENPSSSSEKSPFIVS